MEIQLLLFLNRLAAAPQWRVPIIFLAEYAGWFLLAIFGLYLFWSFSLRRSRGEAPIALLGAVFAWSLASAIKYFYVHPRPHLVLNGLTRLVEAGGVNSFPSGHATFFFALGIGIYFWRRRLGTFFILTAVAIGLSRVAAGVHWPLDVLFGFVLGGSIAYAAFVLGRLVFHRRVINNR